MVSNSESTCACASICPLTCTLHSIFAHASLAPPNVCVIKVLSHATYKTNLRKSRVQHLTKYPQQGPKALNVQQECKIKSDHATPAHAPAPHAMMLHHTWASTALCMASPHSMGTLMLPWPASPPPGRSFGTDSYSAGSPQTQHAPLGCSMRRTWCTPLTYSVWVCHCLSLCPTLQCTLLVAARNMSKHSTAIM